jgi:hypothetical protein
LLLVLPSLLGGDWLWVLPDWESAAVLMMGWLLFLWRLSLWESLSSHELAGLRRLSASNESPASSNSSESSPQR